MTTFSDYLKATAWDLLTDQHGESVTYTPVGGAGAAKTVIFRQLNRAPSLAGNAEVRVDSDAVATPALGDQITRGADEWLVVDLLSVTQPHVLRVALAEATITYTDDSAGTTDVDELAIRLVEREQELILAGYRGQALRVFAVRQADITPTPSVHDSLSDGTNTWAVTQVELDPTDTFYVLTCVRQD